MMPTARSFLIDMLSAAPGLEVPVKDLVRACSVFDIRETSVRVAIVRLSATGMIASAGRGTYRLGDLAQTLATEVGTWRHVEKKVRSWDGSYLAVQVAAKAQTDRPALKRRTRALQLAGFRELDQGFALRPDNIVGSVTAVRTRLEALGLVAPVFRATDFDLRTETAIRKLWDGKALTASYRRTRERLEKWMTKAHALTPEVAARESFLLGGDAIRQIIYDPLLPAPFIDTAERKAFVDAMRTFDRVGRSFWMRLFGVRLGAAHDLGPNEGWVHG